MQHYIKTMGVGVIVFLIFVGSAYAIPLTTDYRSFTISFEENMPTTSGVYDEFDLYRIAQPWEATLTPMDSTHLSSAAGNFLNVLSTAFPITAGWSYGTSGDALSDNSLVVHTYDVLGTPTRVGAEFHAEYIPHGTDPTSNIHWIQVVTNNYPVSDDIHGNTANVVDTISPGGRSPYYDDDGSATDRQFYDFPDRIDADMSHTWVADLFLVTGPDVNAGPGEITFYNGIRWGWENQPAPEPSTLLLMASGLAGLVGLARKTLFN